MAMVSQLWSWRCIKLTSIVLTSLGYTVASGGEDRLGSGEVLVTLKIVFDVFVFSQCS
jgi:hypothetical protein